MKKAHINKIEDSGTKKFAEEKYNEHPHYYQGEKPSKEDIKWSNFAKKMKAGQLRLNELTEELDRESENNRKLDKERTQNTKFLFQ